MALGNSDAVKAGNAQERRPAKESPARETAAAARAKTPERETPERKPEPELSREEEFNAELRRLNPKFTDAELAGLRKLFLH